MCLTRKSCLFGGSMKLLYYTVLLSDCLLLSNAFHRNVDPVLTFVLKLAVSMILNVQWLCHCVCLCSYSFALSYFCLWSFLTGLIMTTHTIMTFLFYWHNCALLSTVFKMQNICKMKNNNNTSTLIQIIGHYKPTRGNHLFMHPMISSRFPYCMGSSVNMYNQIMSS